MKQTEGSQQKEAAKKAQDDMRKKMDANEEAHKAFIQTMKKEQDQQMAVLMEHKQEQLNQQQLVQQ